IRNRARFRIRVTSAQHRRDKPSQMQSAAQYDNRRPTEKTIAEELVDREAAAKIHLPIFCAPLVRREIFRFAALRWITPFWAARMISGSADLTAASAAALSPDLIASSALRTAVRMRERRAELTLVRRAITRAALRADEVLAIRVFPYRAQRLEGSRG